MPLKTVGIGINFAFALILWEKHKTIILTVTWEWAVEMYAALLQDLFSKKFFEEKLLSRKNSKRILLKILGNMSGESE